MKRRTLVLILVLEAAVIAAIAALTQLVPSLFSSVLAFPMEQIAVGMKALSETGAAGNGAALLLMAGLSLIPSVFAFRCPRGREYLPEKVVLYILSAVLLIAFYGMVSPAAFHSDNPDGYLKYCRAAWALTVWTVFILFIVLRLIRLFRAGSREKLLRYLRVLLCVLAMYIVALLAVSLVTGILLPSGNTVPSAADIAVGILSLASSLVPLLFDIVIILRILAVLEIAASPEQDGLPDAASRLSGVSCLALAVTTGLCAVRHIVQILFLNDVTNVTVNVDVPVVSIVFVVVILLFSRLLTENKQLREDNSLII